MYMIAEVSQYVAVASFAEAWIEIFPAVVKIFLFRRLLRGGVDWNCNISAFEGTCCLSPPSRRRGLKCIGHYMLSPLWRSPPSRRRGLKYISWYKKAMESRRLLRGGVDWNQHRKSGDGIFLVASFAEAWIEMYRSLYVEPPLTVASFAEAWIEIGADYIQTEWIFVASFAEAWIEIGIYWRFCKCNGVASFAEAWIEITYEDSFYISDSSPPSRRRGLKYAFGRFRCGILCRLLRGGVDWNCQTNFNNANNTSRLLRGGVDWNLQNAKKQSKVQTSRLLRGGVDWNFVLSLPVFSSKVASFAEAWIEIKSTAATTAAKKSPPSRRRGLKYRHTPAVTCTHVASFAEAWIEIRIMYVPYVSPVSRLLRGGVDWNRS